MVLMAATPGKSTKADICAELCRQALMVINAIALVKSVDFIIVGGVLSVLEAWLVPHLGNVTISSADNTEHVTGAEVYQNVSLFMLITGPITFLISLLGWFGAKRRLKIGLAFFLVLQVLYIIILIVLTVTKLGKPLISPELEWQPFSTFILASVLIVGFLQALMVLFSMAVISTSREQSKAKNKVNDSLDLTDFSRRMRTPSYRRNSWRPLPE